MKNGLNIMARLGLGQGPEVRHCQYFTKFQMELSLVEPSNQFIFDSTLKDI